MSYTFENPDSWVDLDTLIICAFEENNMLALSYQHSSFTATTRVLLRRILKEIGHKIIKWESIINPNLKTTDTILTDIPYDKYEQSRDLYKKNMEDMNFEEYVNHDHNNCVESDDNLSQQSDSSEEEQDPPSVL